jgi:nitronate monooxygenase
MRLFYTLKSIWQLREASLKGATYKDYWQAGKSVDGVSGIESAFDVVVRFGNAGRSATDERRN